MPPAASAMVGEFSLKKDRSKLIKSFIENAIIQGTATYEGDYKRGNKASNRLFEIIKIIKEDTDFGKGVLDELIIYSEPNVQIWACGTALEIGYEIEKAEETLKNISQIPGIGILGLNAKMTLKVLKEKN